jgi:hypothetical protein
MVVSFFTNESTKETDLFFIFGDVKVSVDVVSAIYCCHRIVEQVDGEKARVNEGLVSKGVQRRGGGVKNKRTSRRQEFFLGVVSQQVRTTPKVIPYRT